MSRRIHEFAAVITQPLNVYNFEIRITRADGDKVDEGILLTVQSTTFPSESLRKMQLNYKGEKISYPAKPEIGGDWKISVPENDKGSVRKELDRLKNAMYDQKTGALVPGLWYDVQVFQKDLSENIVFSVILHGCWLVGRGETQLKTEDVTTNWAMDYTFNYTWIEDVMGNNDGTPNPLGNA